MLLGHVINNSLNTLQYFKANKLEKNKIIFIIAICVTFLII